MTTRALDIHKFIRTVTDSGLPENQAEAIAEAFRAAQVEADPVTNADLIAHDTNLRRASQHPSGLLPQPPVRTNAPGTANACA